MLTIILSLILIMFLGIMFLGMLVVIAMMFLSPKKYFFDKKHNYNSKCKHRWKSTGELNGSYCVYRCSKCKSEELITGSGPSG